MAVGDTQNLSALFGSAVNRSTAIQQIESYTSLTLDDVGGPDGVPSASFDLDPPGAGLKSTQQIPLDFSKFENHTFFNSAESNVNVAFERIINHYPFDGTYTERQSFIQGLTGFEKYVFDQFPKSKNFARFDASANNYIKLDDYAGSSYPTLSRDNSGKSILDPGLGSISFEMQFFPPEGATNSAIILQKLSGSNGISLVASQSAAAATTTDVQFYVSSASIGLSASMSLTKGKFNHVVAQFNRLAGEQKLELYLNEELKATSSMTSEIGLIDFTTSSLYIGSGSTHSSLGFTTFEPILPLSGALDELRIFHTTRSLADQRSFATKNIYNSENLKLYYRFNEVTGTYAGNTVVLDGSGKSLHGSYPTSAAAAAGRGTTGEFSSVNNPMILERPQDNPVLFPAYSETTTLNSNLLTSASQYDANNPNLITRLIPQHYLLEAAEAEGFADEDANTGDAIFANTAFPGGAQIPSSQIIATLLFMYGKFFDELKIFIDHFSQFDHVSYDSNEGLADSFLPIRASQLGFDLPSQFTAAKFAQFLLAENIDVSSAISAGSLRDAQNKLWRRILVSLPKIMKSKGTRGAVSGILNTLGIENEKVFKITEFGGRNVNNINSSKKERVIELKFLDFSGSFYGASGVDGDGFATSRPVIKSTYLSASRTEPGMPKREGSSEDEQKRATATVTFAGSIAYGQTITIISTDGTSVTYTAAATEDTSAGEFDVDAGFDDKGISLAACIAVKHAGKITTSGPVFVDGVAVLTLTQDVRGAAGNNTITEDLGNTTASGFTGGLGSSNASDGLLTSASFTVEGLYKFDNSFTGSTHFLSQSLFRLLTTGAVGTSVLQPSLVANVVAFRPRPEKGDASALRVFFSDNVNTQMTGSTPSPLSMSMYNVDVTDGNIWHVSFGRNQLANYSASYFLNAKKFGDESSKLFSSRVFAPTRTETSGGLFNNVTTHLNSSGTFIAVGSQSIERRTLDVGKSSVDIGLNGNFFNDQARVTTFSGKLSQLRFWSKGLDSAEVRSHALDPDSLGVINPNVNFCFGSTLSGSFERLRLAATIQQPTTSSDTSGDIDLFDFAQSEVSGVFGAPWLSPIILDKDSRLMKFHMSGTGFGTSTRLIKKTQVRSVQFTSEFDVNATNNKVFIETLEDASIAERLAASSVNDEDYLRPPILENDNRFLVSVTTSQALNEDIMKIFGTLESIENAIGAYETTFGYQYPDIRHLSEIYFHRLESKINLSTFFNFFRFFDDTLSSLIQAVIPQNTDFLGVRFIVKPHVLERGKFKHYGENVYLTGAEQDRDPYGENGNGLEDYGTTVGE